MRKLYALFLMLLASLMSYAQLEVKPGSFKEVPGFVNLNPDENYQLDDNDLPFAVIKVRTENINDEQRRELKFEGNGGTFIMLEYKTGEVWVYLTAKYATYLKISHPDLSSIEFMLPYDLQPKKGYEMTLVNKQSNAPGSGTLTVKTKPENGAFIVLNGMPLNQKTPYTGLMIAAGEYTVIVTKERYKAVTKTVNVVAGENTVVEIEMPLDVAKITLTADNMTDVYIDDVFKKRGTWSGELDSGTHDILYRKQNYRDATQTIVVEPEKPKTYSLDMYPIYGEISVTSNPIGAKIFVDDIEKGVTPMVITDIIIGQHTVKIKKDGFNSYENNVTVYENKRVDISETLTIGKDLTIETGNKGDKIYIDGKMAGYSPLKTAVKYGKHTITAYNDNKSAYQEIKVEKYDNKDKVVLVMREETFGTYARTGYKFLTINAAISQYNDISYGLTLGMMKKTGWFLSVTTNFNNDTKFDYECDADHYISLNGNLYYPEYTGNESYSSLSVMGGFLMRLSGPVAIRLGAGYGLRTQRYETNNGYWIKDSSLSSQGIDVSLGLQWNFKGLVISIDGVSNNFNTFETKIGIGYGHKKK